MEYQKIINFLHNTSNQPSKFRTKNWVEGNDESRWAYNTNSQIKFKNTMLKSSLCNYSDAYILPFTNCISEINNTQVDNVKNIDIVMPMYNLIEYSGNYTKTAGSLWQYCKDILAVNDKGNNEFNELNWIKFNGANATDSFNFKPKKTGQTGNNGRIDGVEIIVSLKYLSNF